YRGGAAWCKTVREKVGSELGGGNRNLEMMGTGKGSDGLMGVVLGQRSDVEEAVQ
ncbi:hypothetical protein A2U01_0045832, partial [Trifolium medium]|nr:hypothetical protein [Trifolium medium]